MQNDKYDKYDRNDTKSISLHCHLKTCPPPRDNLSRFEAASQRREIKVCRLRKYEKCLRVDSIHSIKDAFLETWVSIWVIFLSWVLFLFHSLELIYIYKKAYLYHCSLSLFGQKLIILINTVIMY